MQYLSSAFSALVSPLTRRNPVQAPEPLAAEQFHHLLSVQKIAALASTQVGHALINPLMHVHYLKGTQIWSYDVISKQDTNMGELNLPIKVNQCIASDKYIIVASTRSTGVYKVTPTAIGSLTTKELYPPGEGEISDLMVHNQQAIFCVKSQGKFFLRVCDLEGINSPWELDLTYTGILREFIRCTSSIMLNDHTVAIWGNLNNPFGNLILFIDLNKRFLTTRIEVPFGQDNITGEIYAMAPTGDDNYPLLTATFNGKFAFWSKDGIKKEPEYHLNQYAIFQVEMLDPNRIAVFAQDQTTDRFVYCLGIYTFGTGQFEKIDMEDLVVGKGPGMCERAWAEMNLKEKGLMTVIPLDYNHEMDRVPLGLNIYRSDVS